MSWVANHPNWLAKAKRAGWSAHEIYRVGIGLPPSDSALAAYKALKTGGSSGTGGAPAGNPAAPGPVTSFDQGAFDYMVGVLKQYNLASLAGPLRDLILGGTTSQGQVEMALQNTSEWKTRFAGNEMLRQAGLPVLDVGEYLSAERSYAQALKQYGLPQGFYDDPSDFAKWIGNSVSPNEVMQRAQMWADVANRQDPAVKAQLASMGMSDGDLIAFMMDPSRATPLIQQKYQTTLIGAAARRSGVVADNGYLEKLAGMGVTEQQAQQGYGLISESMGALNTLAQVYGVDYNQRDFESEVFENSGGAAKKRKRLASQERAAFGGSSGVVKGSLTQNTAGQY